MTQKSKSQLDASFVTNTQRLVTQAHVRDLIDTFVHSHGSLHISAPAATAIPVPGTFYKAGGTTVIGAAHRFTMPANNRLTYGGIVAVHSHIVCNISTTVADN